VGVIKFMNDGTVKYENYQDGKGKGMKNKRTKKVERLRRLERENRMEAKKNEKRQSYKKKDERPATPQNFTK
jgi:hypothetical protein